MSEDIDKAARQARLSKALSAAYLTHQITQLEDKVTNSHISNPPHRGGYATGGNSSNGQPVGKHSGFSAGTSGIGRQGGQPRQLFDDGLPPPMIRGRGRGGGAVVGPRGRGGSGPPGGRGGPPGRGRGRGGGGRGRGGAPDHISRDGITQNELILPPMVESNVFPFHGPREHGGFQGAMGGGGGGEHRESHGHSHRDGRNKRDPERFVVDASALLWAPGGIRGILKCGGEIIVPLECIRTLDILKKGMSTAAVAARAATRFIEEAQSKTRAYAPSSGEEDVVVNGVRGIGKALRPGMWFQGEGEFVEIFSADRDAVDGKNQPQAPPYITTTLQCALFFRAQWEVPSSTKILAISHPPASATHDDSEEDPYVRKYRHRADGYELEEWAEKADVGCRVMDLHKRGTGWERSHFGKEVEDELEAGAEALPDNGGTTRGGSGRGRGRGRGGGGGGRGRYSDTPLSTLPSPETEIRALHDAGGATPLPRQEVPPTALPKYVPGSGQPRPRDVDTSRPPQLTAAALEQSQVAISQRDNAKPRLDRPPAPAMRPVVVSNPDARGGGFKSLNRDEGVKERPYAQRGSGRVPPTARNHAVPRHGNRRPEDPPAAVAEPVVPKMTLLQRPKG